MGDLIKGGNDVLQDPKIVWTQISKSVIELVGKGTKVGFTDVKIVSVLTQLVVLNIAVENLKRIYWL